MCWSESVSFATFAVGTLFNLTTYAYLRRVQSRTLLTLWYWEYTLLMQIPEGIVWNRISENGDTAAPSRAAMLLNVTQPIALTVILTFADPKRARAAQTACLMYTLLILSEFDILWRGSETIAPQSGCDHLNLGFWNGGRTTLYVFATLFAFSTLPSLFWAAINSTIFLGTMLLAILLYPCGGGSMWCWSISSAGLMLAFADLTIRWLYPRYWYLILNAKRLRFVKDARGVRFFT